MTTRASEWSLALLIALYGCSSSTPPNTLFGKDAAADARTATDSGAASTGPDTGGTVPMTCFGCQSELSATGGACEAKAMACEGNTACSALLSCVNNCSNESCADSCRSSNAGGVTDYEAFVGCLCGPPCASLCASACVAFGGSDAGASCDMCQLKATAAGGACFSQASMCNADTSCVTLLDCLNTCAPSDSSCVTQCEGASTDAGRGGIGAVDMCLCTAPACGSECPARCGG